MKILAINGSHRGKKGYTQFLIDKVLEGGSAAGAQCESVTLAEINIKRCTGCFTCQKEDRLLKCIYDEKDDARAVFDKMRAADIIVFATPVYVFNMSSLLKNLFDRYPATSNCNEITIAKSGLFFHPIDKKLCSKPFVTIICQDNLENETHKNILSYFKTYSRFMDASYVGSLVRKSGMTAGHGRDQSKLEKYPVLNDIYQAFYDAGRELATGGKVSLNTQKRANKELIHIPLFVRIMSRVKFFHKIIEEKSKNTNSLVQ